MSWTTEEDRERYALDEEETYLWYKPADEDGPDRFYISDSCGYDAMSVSLETLQKIVELATRRLKPDVREV